MLNFVYEDYIKIRNKYFLAISRILLYVYLSKKTISRPPQSHETILLTYSDEFKVMFGSPFIEGYQT
jgi:hypothetical protein